MTRPSPYDWSLDEDCRSPRRLTFVTLMVLSSLPAGRRHIWLAGAVALCLAIALMRLRIEDFFAKGGKVLDVEDGSEYEPQELWAILGH